MSEWIWMRFWYFWNRTGSSIFTLALYAKPVTTLNFNSSMLKKNHSHKDNVKSLNEAESELQLKQKIGYSTKIDIPLYSNPYSKKS